VSKHGEREEKRARGRRRAAREEIRRRGRRPESPEHLLGGQAQAGGGVGNVQEQGTQLLGCLNKEDNWHFADTPWLWGISPGNFKTTLLCIFCDSNKFKKL
jgi:hypothetical protein